MLVSIHQIDFITDSGVTTRLLSVGDLMADTLEIPAQNQSDEYSVIGADWGGSTPMGNARRSLSWACVREHASHAAAAGFVIRHPATMPLRTPGKLRVSISGGEVWDFLNAVVTSSSPNQYKDGDFATITAYQASAGEAVPAASLTLYAGIPWNWILQNWEDISTTWENL